MSEIPETDDQQVIQPRDAHGFFPTLIGYCVDNPFIVLLCVALITLLGNSVIRNTKLDALPDLSDNQVIVLADWAGRGPRVIEDQVAYPLSTSLSALPHVTDIRSMSNFGFCMIYIIFDDSVDIYWARTRVSERLTTIGADLPEGVVPRLGPEGTGVGHIYWYLVQNDDDPATPEHSLADLRSIQDWYIRYQLATVPGVAEVASGGGFMREYHVDVLPDELRRYGITVNELSMVLRNNNMDVGGRLLEQSDTEFFVRSEGYLGKRHGSFVSQQQVIDDIGNIVIEHTAGGIPVLLSQVAIIQQGSAVRRGIIDHNGEGEAVTGIVVMQYGENAQSVINGVKDKLVGIRRGLPAGVVMETAHDRSWLIGKSLATLKHALTEEAIVVSAIIFLFLLSLRPSLVVVLTLPVAVLIGFIGMNAMGITSNIMSLGGIAIAIGVIVDDGIVMVENCHSHLARLWEHCRKAGRKPTGLEINQSVKEAAQQVGKPVFFTTLIIITSFGPVFFPTGQEGTLLGPLAYTNSLVMLASAVMAVTLVPVLMKLLMRGRMLPEERNPLSRFFNWLYLGPLKLCLQLRWLAIVISVASLIITVPVFRSLGNEFMPNLNEGELVYMPTTLPNVTVTEAKRILQLSDKIMKDHPLVSNVVGKLGRADTATDPAPVSMIETFVQFYPREDWEKIDPKYKDYTIGDIRNDLDKAIRIPGVTNGWTMPIINRIQMLATGVRTDIGIKIYGDDTRELSRLAVEASHIAETVPGIKDVFAERLSGGRYLDIEIDRESTARYGLNVGDVQRQIELLIGGMKVTRTVEGRERYNVQVRYASDYRDNVQVIEDTLIETPHQGVIPLSSVASVNFSSGPPFLASENSLLRTVVFANIRDRDIGGTVTELDDTLARELMLPPGYYFRIAGQWENIQRARARLMLLVPAVLMIIFIFLYLTFNSLWDTLIIYVSLPFAFTGGVWYLHLLNLNISVAVWVGFIALFGMAVNTGVLMIVYLQEALDKRLAKGWLRSGDVYSATLEGAGRRVRPKLMTVSTSLIGLLPLMWATGIGSDVLKPIAAPLIGGLASSTLMVLFILPILFFWQRSWQHRGIVRRER